MAHGGKIVDVVRHTLPQIMQLWLIRAVISSNHPLCAEKYQVRVYSIYCSPMRITIMWARLRNLPRIRCYAAFRMICGCSTLRHCMLTVRSTTIDVPKNCQTFDQISPIEFGGNAVSVIHTPGHTRGSVAIAFDNFIFTGDTLMKNHLGRTDLPGGDREERNITALGRCDLWLHRRIP
ncbi:MAG: MBL fold metallo-hydrolase [Calditrichia bacterium]